MKYRLLFLMILMLSVNVLQSQTWSELSVPSLINDGSGFSTYDYGSNIVADGKGYFYVTGYFDGKIKFGSIELTGKGGKDIFVAKLDSIGNWIWAIQAGGASADYGRDVSVDGNGNVFITGYFFGTATFGTSNLTSLGQSDIFVAKLNSSGNWVWAKSAGGSGFDRGNSISVSSVGMVYLGGVYEGISTFGSTQLTSVGSKDIFLAKLNSTGSWQWAKSAGGTGTEECASIKYSNTDKFIIATGFFGSSCLFGDTTCTSKGLKDIYVSKLDTTGKFLWTRPVGSTRNEEGKSIALDNSSDIYICGYFENNIKFGSQTLSFYDLKDIYAAKINQSGVWQWGVSATGLGMQEAYGISTDSHNNAYITGYFYNSFTLGSTTLTSTKDKDLFVARINPIGSFDWAYSAPCTSSIDAFAIATDNSGNCFTFGSYYSQSTFGTYSFKSFGESDIFLSKIDSSGTWLWATSLHGYISKVTSKAIEIDKNGNRFITGRFYGNIIIGTDTLKSNGGSDIFIAKTDKNGNWIWGKSYGGIYDDYSNDISIDSSSNVYITGCNYSSFKIGNDSLTNNGINDILFTKFDSSGTPIVAYNFGSFGMDEGCSIVTLDDGTTYLTGYYNDSFNFASTNLNSLGGDDIFVAKFSSANIWEWASSAGGADYDEGLGISATKDGQIYVTGHYETDAYFGDNQIFVIGGDDIFISRISDSGTWLWSNTAGSDNWNELGKSVVNDISGNVYITGSFRGIGTFGTDYGISRGNSDIFISKLDSLGNWIWSRFYGGIDNDEGVALALDKCNNLYLTGNFYSNVDFDGTILISNGSQDMLLCKIESNSTISLIKSVGGLFFDEAIDVRALDCYNQLFCGNYFGSIAAGSLSSNLFSNVDESTFIIKQGILTPESMWSFKSNTGKSSLIKVPASITPKLSNRDLIPGDAIGVFYLRNANLQCAGFGKWEGSDLTFTVWGDNDTTLIKDGMANSEKMNFKLFDALRGIDTLVEVGYKSGPSVFMNDSISIVKSIPKNSDTLKIPLKFGWNMISSYIYPIFNPKMDSVFFKIKNSIAIVKNSSGYTYIPEFGINTIGNWNIQQGYMLYAKNVDTLVITGVIVEPDTMPIICKQGWNMISYLRRTQISTPIGFESLLIDNSLVIAKNSQGQTYIPEYGIDNIVNLQPKYGYLIYLKNADTIFYSANDLPTSRFHSSDGIILDIIDNTSSTNSIKIPDLLDDRKNKFNK